MATTTTTLYDVPIKVLDEHNNATIIPSLNYIRLIETADVQTSTARKGIRSIIHIEMTPGIMRKVYTQHEVSFLWKTFFEDIFLGQNTT